jgi:hypothetical protein
LRYRFRALKTVAFGASGAANTIRGALGWNLRRIAGETAYARLFQPRADRGPSGLANPPRPFVLRASHLDAITVPAGECFQFDVHLFETGGRAAQAMDWLSDAFAHTSGAAMESIAVSEIEIDLGIAPPPISRLRVDFITPTELKAAGDVVVRPEFPILLSRARDRVATLQSLYGSGTSPADFVGLGERAGRVTMESCELKQVERARRSSRTGQTHGLGGVTGHAIYSGNLAEFWPWLDAAQWTGVGRQTVWGKGQIKISSKEKSNWSASVHDSARNAP